MDLDYTFEKLFQALSNPEFGEKLVGELPLFIQPFPSNKQLEVENQVSRLASRLNKKNLPTTIVNLFDLSLDILRQEDILDTILEQESEISHSDVAETLDGVLDIASVIIPQLKEIIDEHHPKYLFVTGVGSVYPFIRSHGILNNVDELAGNCKLVLFFPGEYDNLQLKLFGRIFDENYYRGVNLNDINY